MTGRPFASAALVSLLISLAAGATPKRRATPTVLPVSTALRSLRSDLVGRVDRAELPSLEVGVAQEGNVLWLEGMGWADREAKVAATPDTVYPVASVSKSITATVAAVLVEKHRIHWDDDATALLPSLSNGITVRHLVDNSSGLPHLWWYEYASVPDSHLQRDQVLTAARVAAFPPGTGFLYSNLNLEIAAQCLEKVTGEKFEETAERELFAPLGMNRTTSEAWVGRGDVAVGYSGAGKRVPFQYRLRPRGGAGFFSSASDLLSFAQFHLGEIKQAQLLIGSNALAENHGEGTAAGAHGYSHGWGRIDLSEAGVALVSDGEMLGGTAVVMIFPLQKIAVVLLTNSTTDLLEVATLVADAVAPGLSQRLGDGIQRLKTQWSASAAMPTGTWKGRLNFPGSTVATTVDFDAQPDPTIRFGEGPLRILDRPTWDRGMLEATIAGDFPLPSDKNRHHQLDLTLHVTDSAIDGFATDDLADDTNHRRYGLPYPIHLSRASR